MCVMAYTFIEYVSFVEGGLGFADVGCISRQFTASVATGATSTVWLAR